MGNFNVNPKKIVTPVAAVTVMCSFLIYSRTSVNQAKRNAELHRSADGGQISWRNENLRRHGVLERPKDDDRREQLDTRMQTGQEQSRSNDKEFFQTMIQERMSPSHKPVGKD